MIKSAIRRQATIFALLASTLCVTPMANAADDIQERTIRWGHLQGKDHPLSEGVNKFAQIVEQKSGGKLKVREFPNSSLGSEIQQQSALQGGTQEMMSASTTTLAGIVKEYGVLDFSFLFANEAEADALLDGPIGKRLMDRLPGARPRRARLLGKRLSQRDQQQAPDRAPGRPGRPEDPRDAEPGLPGNLQGRERESDSDGVRRALHGAGDQDSRRPGEPVTRSSSPTSSTRCRST